MAISTKIRNTQIQAGTLTNNEISASAAIVESKIAFNTSTGHDHDGSNSKVINSANFTSHLVWNEIPTGTINGTNTTYTLAAVPIVSSGVNPSVGVAYNGIQLQPGTAAGNLDFFINGNATLTMSFIPASGDVILVNYAK